MNLTVYNSAGEQVGKYEIDPSELSPKINKQLLHDAVVMYQANLRQGTFRTKSRGEVAGTTKKMYRQKGTGNARAGSRRSGVRRGGGHIFAKRPRDFGWRMPRKALQSATRMALAARLADEEVTLVESLNFESPKTSSMAATLESLGVAGKTVLVSSDTHNGNLWKSARNIRGVTVSPVAELNALLILQPRAIVMTTAAIDAFREETKRVREGSRTKASRKQGGRTGARTSKRSRGAIQSQEEGGA
jgi:large subunit ribosomal protein L4